MFTALSLGQKSSFRRQENSEMHGIVLAIAEAHAVVVSRCSKNYPVVERHSWENKPGVNKIFMLEVGPIWNAHESSKLIPTVSRSVVSQWTSKMSREELFGETIDSG